MMPRHSAALFNGVLVGVGGACVRSDGVDELWSDAMTDQPSPPLMVSDSSLDTNIATEVATSFLASKNSARHPIVAAAYAALQSQSDALFVDMTTDLRWPMRVVFTNCAAPYDSDSEMIHAVRSEKVLEVATSSTKSEGLHPTLGCDFGGAYDRFRAVHDLLGHVQLATGFDRNSEYMTWRSQHRHYRGLARWALATELHAKNSVLHLTGHLADHKAVLLEPNLLARSLRGKVRATRLAQTHRPAVCLSRTQPGPSLARQTTQDAIGIS
jgi:hypothetical protein